MRFAARRTSRKATSVIACPSFKAGNFERNLALADEVCELADEKGVQPAQLVLAWLLALGTDVVPIFGTRRAANLAANVEAVELELTADDLERLDELAPNGATGGRPLDASAHASAESVIAPKSLSD